MSEEKSVKTVEGQISGVGKSAYHRPVLRDCGTLQEVTLVSGNGSLDDTGGYYNLDYTSGTGPN